MLADALMAGVTVVSVVFVAAGLKKENFSNFQFMFSFLGPMRVRIMRHVTALPSAKPRRSFSSPFIWSLK